MFFLCCKDINVHRMSSGECTNHVGCAVNLCNFDWYPRFPILFDEKIDDFIDVCFRPVLIRMLNVVFMCRHTHANGYK